MKPGTELPPHLQLMERPIHPWRWGVSAGLGQGLLGAAVATVPDAWPSPYTLDLAAVGLPDLPSAAWVLSFSLIAGAIGWQLGRRQRQHQLGGERMVRRLFEVIDLLPDPAAVRDAQGRYVLWNRAAEQRYGLRAAHAYGHRPQELFPPAFVAALAAIEQRAIETQESVEERVDVPAAYGRPTSRAWVRMSPIYYSSEPKRLRGIVSVVTDITEQEQRDAAARAEHAKLKMALEASHAGIWSVDVETSSARYDLAYARLLHWEGDLETFHQEFDFRKRLHPEDRDTILAAEAASMKAGLPFAHDYRILCMDGKYRAFSARGRPLVDADGRMRFIGIVIEATA